MMLVMRVRHMRVRMPKPAMPMRVRLARRILETMCVLMRVMHVWMRVREHLVFMLVFVNFGKKQPHANGHQGAGNK